MDNIEYTFQGPHETAILHMSSLRDTIQIKVRETHSGRVLSEYAINGFQLAALIDIVIQNAEKK